MAFGCEDLETYSIAVDGTGKLQDAPCLHINHIMAMLREIDTALTILTTLCYIGGWVLQPDLNVSALNTTNSEEKDPI